MRKKKFILTLDDNMYDYIIESLIEMKNSLLTEGKYSDPVDEALVKLIKAKKRHLK